MRGPTREELEKTPPPTLRMSSKTTQAYLAVRHHILTGEYPAGQMLLPKQIEEAYQINNTTTQILLARLANEGLVRVLPIKERIWPYNASLNEYRVADLTRTQKGLLERREIRSPVQEKQSAEREILLLKIQYADAEIARLLALATGDKMVVYRERQRHSDQTVAAISDWYFPFWFADILPEIEQSESDIPQLLQRIGKIPARCSETVEVVHASRREA